MPTQEKHGERQMREETKTSGRSTMDTQFNVFEILQIAEEVQIKAAQFFLPVDDCDSLTAACSTEAEDQQ